MSKNKHGECLIDFLIECKCCIVNGRVTPSLDNYTSVSTKGNAVVDYFAVPQDRLANCVKCDTQLTLDLISSLNLQGLIGERCQPPDHSLMTFTYSFVNYVSSYSTCGPNDENNPDVSE